MTLSLKFSLSSASVMGMAATAAAFGLLTEDMQSLQTESGDNIEKES